MSSTTFSLRVPFGDSPALSPRTLCSADATTCALSVASAAHPFFAKSNIAVFHDHTLQWVLALFCTKPELYKNYKQYRHRQDYFFREFIRFASKYHHFSIDERIYFGSVRKEVAGETNICGGGEKRSGASARYFKNRYHDIESSRETHIDKFAKKYGVSFDSSKKDTRLFLGVTEIWNKLDIIDEIIAGSKWANVRDISYDDESFATPFPKIVDKELVPLDIRNRTMQRFRSSQRTIMTKIPSRQPDVDEDEYESSVPFPIVPFPKMTNARITVIPEGFNENDW